MKNKFQVKNKIKKFYLPRGRKPSLREVKIGLSTHITKGNINEI